MFVRASHSDSQRSPCHKLGCARTQVVSILVVTCTSYTTYTHGVPVEVYVYICSTSTDYLLVGIRGADRVDSSENLLKIAECDVNTNHTNHRVRLRMTSACPAIKDG